VAFWRIATPLVICHAAYQALQGLWLAPWLYDIAGEPRAAVAQLLLATAVAYAFGSVFFGVSSDRLARAGISRMTTYKIGLAISVAMFLLLASGVTRGLPAILAVYGFTAISASLAYALLTPLFPPEMTGRANTASNVLMFGVAFLFQWAVGAVLRFYPVTDGRYSPEGYAMAFGILGGLQVLALAWLLPMKSPQPRL
jgi:MFS family permease